VYIVSRWVYAVGGEGTEGAGEVKLSWEEEEEMGS